MSPDQREMQEIAEKLNNLLRHHRMRNVVGVLSTILPLYWCTSRRFETVTDALDLWRESLNPDMERTIRKAFDDMRYGE